MTQVNEYKGPLAGLNVIDFGHYYAGPLAAMMLADQGANVIRIVKPGKLELKEQQFRLLNRNKKLLTLDLRSPEGNAQALSLIEKADVVIENFRPGVMKRLGLDYTSVKGSNPGLIYLSLPGFASTDKERSHIQAWEGVVGAATGLYTEIQINRELLGFPPVYTLVPLRSMHAGILGAITVMAALLARKKHGVGTVIETPLHDVGMFNMLPFIMIKRPNGEFRPVADPNAELPDNLKPLVYLKGDSEEVQLEKLDKARDATPPFHPCYGHYPCADGRQVFINTFWWPHITERLLKALGIYHQVLCEGFVNVSAWEKGLDHNICNMAMAPERATRLRQIIGEALKEKTAFEWEDIITKAGALAAVIRTRDEWLALEPMLDSGVLTRMDNGKSALTVPARLGEISCPQERALGEHYDEAATITATEADRLFQRADSRPVPKGEHPSLKKGDLLKGLKVVDMANVAAGPTCGYLLAELGADVIKADHPQSHYSSASVGVHLFLDPGKRSLLADIKTVQGREIFHRLVTWADVVTHNILDDTAERMGATHAQLQEINPNVISGQITAFSGTRRGGWENRPGFDFSLHAASGQMAHYGTPDRPYVHGMAATADTPGGFMLAFSVLLGVWQRDKTGYAGEARTSLAHAINYSQLPYMISENGNSYWGESRGQFAVGDHWWQRLYECKDGWIYVGAHEDCANVLAETVTGRAEGDVKALEAAFATQERSHWEAKLTDQGIGCHRTMTVDDMYEAAVIHTVDNDSADGFATDALEILRWDDHPCGLPVVFPAPTWVRVGEYQSYKRPKVAGRLGGDTQDVLRELGYSDGQIAKFIRLRTSFEFHPSIGKKDAYFA